ncbi:hypothetical protein PENOC_111850 [Penicillium occitanis (nom. inval.)]|nr:hypothetical protein PENOC_111850 [Penicillium occitanis (nom. inval.)]
MDGLSGAASVIAVIQLTGSIVEICGGYIGKVKNAKQDILHLQQEIRALTGVLVALNELLQGPGGTELTTSRSLFDNVSKCFATLTHIKEKIDPGKNQNSLRRRVFRALQWPLQQSELLKVISDVERYKSLFSLALQLDQTKTIAFFKQSFNLDSLRIAEGAAFDSYNDQHTECLPGTRTKLLDEVDDWTKSSHGKCIFWLNGMAGTGKSTISRTVAGRLKAKNLLGASFFFKRGEGDRGNARKLFPTLIKQLVTSIPQLMPSIQKAIEDDPDISEKMLREQFEKLILQPLLGTKCGQTSTMVIVIDALDECEQEDDIRLILQLLPQVQKSNSVQLRFLLTSRPYLPLKLGFKGIMNDYQGLILHEIPQPVIEHDISLYIKDKFSQLRMERSLPSDWPGDETIKTLVQRAVPLFISAATLYRFISDTRWNPETRLEAILADQTIYVSRMDSTYMPVLKQLLTGQDEWESQQLVQDFKEIVGVIILLANPLSVNALAQLLKIRISDINNRLSLLQSVLDIPSSLDAPVRLLHLSFRDFLLDPKKKDSSRFWIDEKATHRKIALQCLEIMYYGLKKNICNLPNEASGAKRGSVN